MQKLVGGCARQDGVHIILARRTSACGWAAQPRRMVRRWTCAHLAVLSCERQDDASMHRSCGRSGMAHRHMMEEEDGPDGWFGLSGKLGRWMGLPERRLVT
jgi:hypothetical protein